jgi:hypothetical protein
VRAAAVSSPPYTITGVRIRGFRSIVDLTVKLGPLCAFVGAAQSGKSNLLAALDALLDARAPVVASDAPALIEEPLAITATLASGERVALDARRRTGLGPPVLFLPASERAGRLVAREPEEGVAAHALDLFRQALAEQTGVSGPSAALPAASLVDGLEACCVEGVSGLVLLIEEPELYLRPQAQRYLYRLLRTFAQGGNQVLYSTHSANLLNVARLDEIVFVERPGGATRARRARALPIDADFRLLSEFDAARSELLLARAALLVEGQTERLALPFAFAAKGFDVDRENVAIVECGGKGNLPLFARVCRAAGVPFVVLHDRDRDEPLNGEIRALAGDAHTFVLSPDFERAAGLKRGRHKPERAWRSFAEMNSEALPRPLADAIERVLELARGSPTIASPASGKAA